MKNNRQKEIESAKQKYTLLDVDIEDIYDSLSKFYDPNGVFNYFLIRDVFSNNITKDKVLKLTTQDYKINSYYTKELWCEYNAYIINYALKQDWQPFNPKYKTIEEADNDLGIEENEQKVLFDFYFNALCSDYLDLLLIIHAINSQKINKFIL